MTMATLDEFVLARLIEDWPDTITLDLITYTDNVDRLFACYLALLDEYESDDIPEDLNDVDAMHDLREALRDRLEEMVEEGDGVAHAALLNG